MGLPRSGLRLSISGQFLDRPPTRSFPGKSLSIFFAALPLSAVPAGVLLVRCLINSLAALAPRNASKRSIVISHRS
jgi:hypothetical protein